MRHCIFLIAAFMVTGCSYFPWLQSQPRTPDYSHHVAANKTVPTEVENGDDN